VQHLDIRIVHSLAVFDVRDFSPSASTAEAFGEQGAKE